MSICDAQSVIFNDQSPVDFPSRIAGKHIEDLPNEIIFKIAEIIYNTERKYPRRNKHYSVLYALSRVNSRFRALVLPLLRRNLCFKRANKFQEFLDSFKDGRDKAAASSVRKIQVGAIIWYASVNWSFDRPAQIYLQPDAMLPFINLVSFEAIQVACTDSDISALRSCQLLTTVAIAWVDGRGWPELSGLPALQAIRLYITKGQSRRRKQAKRKTTCRLPGFCPSITLLALYNKIQFDSGCADVVDSLWSLHFPNLHVLVIDNFHVDCTEVFPFIHGHPTLLKLSLSTAYNIRLEALLALVDGTGTWRAEPSNHHKLCQITAGDYNPDDPVPPVISDWHFVTGEFGFVRTPLDSMATLWRSPLGSAQPRYSCTALSLELAYNSAWRNVLDYQPQAKDLLMSLTEFCTSLEELHITSQSFFADMIECDIISFLTGIGDALKTGWTELRTLTVYWPHLHRSRQTGNCWGSSKVYAQHSDNSGHHIPCLDAPFPPIADSSDSPSRLATLETLRTDREYRTAYEEIVAAIPSILHMDDHTELAEEDEHLVMEAWEARNEKLVTWLVRYIAECCPTLEHFDWWLKYRNDMSWVIWHWDIKCDAARRPMAVLGKLLWPGGMRMCGPLTIAVGSELEYVQRSWLAAGERKILRNWA